MKSFRTKVVSYNPQSNRHCVFTHLRGYWHYSPFKFRFICPTRVINCDSNGQYLLTF